MVTLSTHRRDRKKVETRTRIMAAGIKILSDRGIDRATVDEIAAAADVGKGTIYNYFRTKEDIVIAFLVDLEQRVQHEVTQLVDTDGTLQSILTTFVRFQFELKEPYHPFVRVFLAQMFGHTEAFLPWMQSLQTVIDPPIEQLFAGLRERGMLREDVEIAQLVQVFKVMQLGLTSLWAIEGPPWKGTEQVLGEHIRLLCKGLEARTL